MKRMKLFKSSLPFFLILFFSFFLLVSGCSRPRREQALQTAKNLMETGDLSDTKALENLRTSRELLNRLVKLKIEAAEWNLYVSRRLAKHYRKLKMWPKAIQQMNKLIELQPTEAQWYLDKGRIYSQWSQVDKSKVQPAVKALEIARELGEGLLELEAKYSLALLRAFRQNNTERGRELLREVAYQAPVTSNNRQIIRKARFALGKLEFESSNYSAARQAYKSILDMDRLPGSDKFQALKHLGRVHRQIGARKAAINTYKKAANLNYSDESVQAALDELGASR